MNFILSNYIKTEKFKMNNDKYHINTYLSLVYIEQSNHPKKMSKFKYLQSIFSNPFFTEDNKNAFLDLFCKMQRCYFAFRRLIYMRKFHRAKIIIDYDLLLTPIYEKDRTKTLPIIFNNNKYLFSLPDLINISMSSLTNSPNHFSSPLPIKNPYTNVIFNDSTLYNIYFFIKQNYCIMPQLIHNYFLVNFDLEQFLYENESIIRNYDIQHMLNTTSIYQLKRDILDMLNSNSYVITPFQIHPDFPIKNLVDIFRPYLKLHYIVTYSNNEEHRQDSRYKLYWLLTKFYNDNPDFGRKIINRTINPQFDFVKKQMIPKIITRVSFNMKYIPYHILLKEIKEVRDQSLSGRG